MSTGVIFLRLKAAGAKGWQPYHLHVQIVWKSLDPHFLETSGALQLCTGIPYSISNKCLLPTVKSFKNRKWRYLAFSLRLCTGRTAHRERRGMALLFYDHGTKRGWGVSVTPRPLFATGKDAVPIVQEAGWAPGPVWIGAENLAPTGFRSPDLPARSQSLYRLRYEEVWSCRKSPYYTHI